MKMIQRNRFPITITIVMISLHSSIITCSAKPEEGSYTRTERLPTFNHGEFEVCDTQDCHLSAQQILNNMNKSVNPCVNFYEFACGNFSSGNNKFNSHDHIDLPESLIDRQMHFILDQLMRPNELEHLKIMRTWWRLCRATNLHNPSRMSEVTDVMKEKDSGMPLVLREKWDENAFTFPFDIFRFPPKLEEYNSTLKLTSKMISMKKYAEFFQPTVNESSHGNIHKCMRNEGCKYILDVVAIFNIPRDNSTMNEIMDTIKFARKYQNIADHPESEELLIYDVKQTKDEARMELYEKIMNCRNSPVWSKCILDAVHSARHRPTEIISMSKSDSDLDELLRNTPKKIQANFAAWRRVKGWSNILQLDALKKITSTLLENEKSDRTLTEECFPWIRKLYRDRYVRAYLAEKEKEISIMFNNTKNKLKQSISNIPWILTKLEKKLSDIIDDMKIIDNAKSNFWKEPHQIESDGQFDLSEKLMSSPSLKYILKNNSISIDTVIFNGTSFKMNVPKYLNYGGLGVSIGREISAILHRAKSENPEILKMINEVMEDMSIIIYHPRIINIIRYMLSENEIIGDIMGLKLAYSAYSDFGKEPRLRGLEKFTPRQLFWINAANNWCVKRNGSTRATGDQTPEEIRVRESISSLYEFTRDFKCPQENNFLL